MESDMNVPKKLLLCFQILYCRKSYELYRQLNIWTRLMAKLISQTFTSSYHPFSLLSFDKSTLTRQCPNALHLSEHWGKWLIVTATHSSGLCWLESLVFHKSIKRKVQWHLQSLWTILSNRLGGSKPALCSPEYCSSHLFGSCSKLSNWKDWINLFVLWIH